MKFVMFEGDIYSKDSIVFVNLVIPEPSDKEVLVFIAVTGTECENALYPFSSVVHAREAIKNLFRSLNEG